MKVHTAKLQVESFADGLANLPERLQLKGFKNLTISEAETKLEGLSPELFVRTLRMFAHIIEMAEVEDIVLDGEYYNAFINKKDPNGANTHDNLETVQCVTYENGTRAKRLVWRDEDGNEIGDMIVKINVDDMKNESDAIKRNSDRIVHLGNCTQVVRRKVGLKPKVYKGMKGIPRPTLVGEGNPEPTKGGIDHVTTPLTPGTPTPWGKTGDPHSGKDRLPSDLVNPASEVTKEKNDETNKDYQGYVGDNKATPGAPSISYDLPSGGKISFYPTADGSETVTYRLPGEKNQSGSETNGVNTKAPVGEPKRDVEGTQALKKQEDEGVKAGGNNYVTKEEEEDALRKELTE